MIALVLLTAICAAFAGSQGTPSFLSLLILGSTGFLAAGGSAALNHYYDRDLDSRMQRTRGRPLVTGQVQPRGAWIVGWGMVLVGVLGAAAWDLGLAACLAAGAATYVFIYTRWLKRRTPLNIVIGGLAGSFAVLGGWLAGGGGLTWLAVLLVVLVFVWTPVHFWSFAIVRADDYQAAGVPMLPVVVGARRAAVWVLAHAALSVLATLGIGWSMGWNLLFLTIALAAGLPLIALAVRALLGSGPVWSWRLFKYSGVYLCVVFLGVLLVSVSGLPGGLTLR